MKKKMVMEKKTGEKYASKAAKARHERKESKSEMVKEYGKKAAAKKMAAWVDWSRFRHPPTIQEFPQLAARREKLNRMAASLK